MIIKFTLNTAKEADLFYEAWLYEVIKLKKAIDKYNLDNKDIFTANFCDETEYDGDKVIKEYYVNFFRANVKDRIENEVIRDLDIEELLYQIGNTVAGKINPNFDCE